VGEYGRGEGREEGRGGAGRSAVQGFLSLEILCIYC
jgi:hypothetical protein